jgi:iron complex transport system substrate-binding protein
MRIASLLPSATEIVCALGFQDRLVARSHECDYPPEVRALPSCTAPSIDLCGTSAEIDRRVKEALRQALSIYRVDEGLLRRLRPDLIVTQSQCEVCAVSLREVEAATCTWFDAPARIVSLEPTTLADVWGDVGRVAEALGAPERGTELAGRLRRRVDAVAERARRLPDRPTVVCVEWIEPLMAAGNWTPELVELAGGVNLAGTAGEHSPWLTWDELAAHDPDAIVVAPCGFDLARTRAELAALTRYPAWPGLRAVRAGRVSLADGNHYFNRSGPRLVESLEILAEALHPGAFAFGHEGAGWQRL